MMMDFEAERYVVLFNAEQLSLFCATFSQFPLPSTTEQVRGEAYDQDKALRKQVKQEKPKRKKKSKKAVMYEADDLGDANDAAVHAGLGEQNASMLVKDKIRKMNMPLEKRFQLEEEEEPHVKVVNKGGSKEMTYVPKDARKKPKEKQEESDEEAYSRSKRQRRSMKAIGKHR
jgi:hypothetical protein